MQAAGFTPGCMSHKVAGSGHFSAMRRQSFGADLRGDIYTMAMKADHLQAYNKSLLNICLLTRDLLWTL